MIYKTRVLLPTPVPREFCVRCISKKMRTSEHCSEIVRGLECKRDYLCAGGVVVVDGVGRRVFKCSH